ncbi:MAG: heat-inducible transcriptional repressor HrcA [Ignavibacteriales bacterium]
MNSVELTEREKSILQYVIQQFILSASPVGSRNISKKYKLGLSPATIRNIMADLEDSGFLQHPHTSAGRVPTDRGYRFYVDELMKPSPLIKSEKDKIEAFLESTYSEPLELLTITSTILSELTNQLAFVTYPQIDDAVLEKVQLIKLSSSRLLVVVAIKKGIVKTITLEINSKVDSSKLNFIEHVMNERLSGLKLAEIRKSFLERLRDIDREELRPIIRIFFDSVDKIFSSDRKSKTPVVAGASHVIKQPEFENPENLQGIIELIESKDIIIHLLENKNIKDKDFTISIGSENENKNFTEYSFIVKEYKLDEAKGTVGIIGPKRMEYSKIVSAVLFVAESLAKEFRKTSL